MRICVKGLKNIKGQKNVLKQFLEYLQSELPLKKEVTVILTSGRNDDMTTGVRKPEAMEILAGGRMNIDVLRTLAHEWVHEYQHQKMGVPEGADVPNIGGPIENMASVLASIFLKKFQQQFPQFSRTLYEQKKP